MVIISSVALVCINDILFRFFEFLNIASCTEVKKSDSAVTASSAFVEKRRSNFLIGSLPWKIALGLHPIDE